MEVGDLGCTECCFPPLHDETAPRGTSFEPLFGLAEMKVLVVGLLEWKRKRERGMESPGRCYGDWRDYSAPLTPSEIEFLLELRFSERGHGRTSSVVSI